MSFIRLDAGQYAARVSVDGKESWVGRSKRGIFPSRLFATEAAALSAGDEADEAAAATDLLVGELVAYIAEGVDGERLIVIGNADNDRLWDEARCYDPTDPEAVEDLQNWIDDINRPPNLLPTHR